MPNLEPKVTVMLNVFEAKHQNLLKKLKKLLDKPKEERNKTYIKQILKEAKTIRSLLRKKPNQQICCPHCNNHFDVVLNNQERLC